MQTKIIATIGPKSEDPRVFASLIEKGVSMIRINFSHADFDQYKKIKKIAEETSRKSNKPIKIIQDLQGPRIRVGALPKPIELKKGEEYCFYFPQKNPQNIENGIPINDPYLHADIKAGDPIYLSNGELELKITRAEESHIYGEVIRGGQLSSHKGINVPDTKLRYGGLTEKDIEDVKLAMEEGVDYIALSFVQSAQDIGKLREIIGDRGIKIIAKIERRVAFEHLDEIIKAADAIMVARGDLGIEIPVEELPIMQKHIIRQAHYRNKPVIIATQIMSSMVENNHPTRAEVSDASNAIFDGADALMLSEETAISPWPELVVETIGKIIDRTEDYLARKSYFDF